MVDSSALTYLGLLAKGGRVENHQRVSHRQLLHELCALVSLDSHAGGRHPDYINVRTSMFESIISYNYSNDTVPVIVSYRPLPVATCRLSVESAADEAAADLLLFFDSIIASSLTTAPSASSARAHRFLQTAKPNQITVNR
jgi:hypothetical protein